MKKITILFYGINGTGLGHLSRLLNIARETRTLLHAMDLGADFHFISTSEAPQVAWDFPVYKLPSKSVVANSDTRNRDYQAMAQFFVSNLLAAIRPDILVMDTMPQGAFGEFLYIKPYAKKKVFINRHKDDEYSQSEVHQKHLKLYDLILTPTGREEGEEYVFPDQGVAQRNVFTGKIHGFHEDEAWERDAVREYFAVRTPRLAYISAGGGGDRKAEEDLRMIVEQLLERPEYTILLGYGPLYRGKKWYHERIRPLSEHGASLYFKGIDLAISAGGYNSFYELLAAGTPTLFFSQRKGMDRQDLRILKGVERGWCQYLPSLTPEAIAGGIQSVEKDAGFLKSNMERAREGVSGSLVSAVELIKLMFPANRSFPEAKLLFLVANLRRYWSDYVQKKGKDLEFNLIARAVLENLSLRYTDVELQEIFDDAFIDWQLKKPEQFYEDLLEFGAGLTHVPDSLDVVDPQQFLTNPLIEHGIPSNTSIMEKVSAEPGSLL